ncbi:MinD/ParA family protein [Bacillus sp. FJAT-50079]|uniref:MinD/ParA family protein n=1 Tax=Bacillus sp. FJAT-50079 TaxID=2833577 RepID=UPI001BC91E30|nr:MinD/ParA family protein [Bacillus sp. FJAT-50079]MBS4207605.1 MinD/ParA family protein [Bacillus sp. FJAT-50079]
MKDQAEKLRSMLQAQSESKKMAKTIAVVSGKGGVGKSNISLNLAFTLADRGNRVLLFDLDIGMGNVNILLGRTTSNDLSHFLRNEVSLSSIIHTSDDGVSYISAGNGLNEIIEINPITLERLLQGLKELQETYDYIIFDMAAGANSPALNLLLSADDIFVISTPEPTAMTDAYSMMKFISMEEVNSRFLLICNRADYEEQGQETLRRLQTTARTFLNRDAIMLGVLPEDKHVRQAVISQVAFSKKFPKAAITNKLKKIVDIYVEDDFEKKREKDSFLLTLRRLFSDKGRRK